MIVAEANAWQGTKIQKLILPLAGLVFFVSFFGLATWYLGIEGTVFWFTPAPMNPLVALLFMVTVVLITVLLRWPQTAYHIQPVFVIILLCLIYIVVDKIYAFPFHLDYLFLNQSDAFVGRIRGMSLATAVLLILTTTSLFLYAKNVSWESVIQGVNAAIFLLSTLILIAYLYRVPERPEFFLMAPMTALNFAILSLALLLFRASKGFVGEFTFGAFGRSASRFILPLGFILPIMLGYLRLYFEWTHAISPELGVAVVMWMFVIISAGATWIVARSYNKRIALIVENQFQAQELMVSNKEKEAISASEANLHSLMESTVDNVLMLDAEFRLIVANGNYYRYVKETYNIAIKTGDNALDLVPKERKLALQSMLQRARSEKFVEFQIATGSDENKKQWDVTISPVRAGDQFLGYCIVQRDITERLRQETALEQSRQNLEIIFDNSLDTFVLLDPDARILMFNKQFEIYMRQNPHVDYRAGMTLFDVIAPNRFKAVTEILERVRAGEQVRVISESVFPHATKYYNVVYTPVFDQGTLTHITVSATDISELQTQKEVIDRYRQNLEIIFRNSADNFVLIDSDARLVLFNEGFKRFCHDTRGVTPEPGMSVFDVLPGDRIEASKDIFRRVFQGEPVEVVATTKTQGPPRYFSVRYNPAYVDQKVKFISISAFDVTERKNQELKLEEYRRELETVFNNSNDLLFLIDRNEKLALFNSKLAKYCLQGLGKMPVVGESWHTIVSQNRLVQYQDYTDRAFRGESIDYFDTVETPMGKQHVSTHVRPIFNDEDVTHVMVSITDLTQEIEKDKVTNRYRENLEIIFENSTDQFVLLNPNLEIVVANKAYESFVSQFSSVRPTPGTSFFDTVLPQGKEQAKEIVHRVLQGEPIQTRVAIPVENDLKYYDVNFSPVVKGGGIAYITMTATDVTRQKQQELEIEKHLQNLDIVFSATNDTFLLVSATGKVLLFNKAFERFIKSVADIDPKVGDNFLDVVAPHRRAQAADYFKRVLNGERISLDTKFETRNGDTIYQYLRYEPIFTDSIVTHVSLSAVDVTEKKNQEKLLQQSEQFSRELLDYMHLHIAVIGPRGDIITTNLAWDHFGRANGALGMDRIGSGSNYLSVCERAIADGDETAKEALEGIRAVLNRKREHFEMEYPCDSPSEKRWFQLRVMPFQEDRAITLHQDITHRKKIEHELKQDQYFLEKASESAKIGYWTSEPGNENGKLTWSKEVFKIFGIRESEFSGTNRSFSSRVHPDDRPRVAEISRQALERGTIYHVDHRIVLPDGSVRWVNERAQVLRDEKGNATLMVGIVQDINDRKITEQVLREYNERFEILSKATNDAIWDLDIEKDTVTWNYGLLSIFGYDLREIKGVKHWWREKIHPDDHARVIREMNAIFEKHGTNWTTEYRYRCANGTYKNVLDRAYIIYSNDKPVRMIGAMQDITEVVQYRQDLEGIINERTEKLNQSLAKEKDLVDLKSRFISIASHEFRTPLATISLSAGFLNRYAEKLKTTQITEKALNIEMQVRHMQEMLDDVLFVGRSDEAKIKAELVETPIEIFEKLALEALQSRGNTHQLMLSVKTKAKMFPSDRRLLRHIVFNLISNAIKFSPKAKKVYLTVTERQNHLLVSVQDEGIGIPPDEIKNLFSSFVRASNATHIEGTGLGLLIIHRAVGLLKGKIDVVSEVGKGTEFTVELPL